MNEESSSSSSKRRGPTTYPPPDASAATDDATEASLTRRSKNDRIPLSLGKASLRIRLEAYYSLISPAILSDRTAWLRKYDQIYEKYGGTHSGERKLATKLAKKYGTAVRLLLVSDSSSLVPRFPTDSNRSNDLANTRKSNLPRDESWYQLRKEEAGSGIVDFLSSRFDPVEALTGASGRGSVARANPWMEELLPKTILDNIGKCAALLPTDDPLRKENHLQLQLRKSAASRNSSSQQNQLALGTAAAAESVQIRPTTLRKQTNHDLHPFEAIASHLDTGPHSLLFRLRRDRKRARVVVRYVNMVRGTITGSLVAFDKHMNLILRDVEEIYSPRINDKECRLSNLELELERRRRLSLDAEDLGTSLEAAAATATSNQSGGSSIDYRVGKGCSAIQEQHQHQSGNWKVRRRQMKQLLVRGDMVVSIYEAAQERTNVQKSRYRKRIATSALVRAGAFGTSKRLTEKEAK